MMSDPIKAIEIFTKCDLKAGKQEGMGNHKDYIRKAIEDERYEEVAAMKRAYNKQGKQFPNVR